MNGLALLLVAAAVGVDYGWQPTADGDLEYIIQIEPVTLTALAEGQEVISQIDPYVQTIRRFRIRVGTDEVPRRGMPPRVPKPSADAATFLDNTPGVKYGWQPVATGGLEYIVQLDASRLEALKRGEQIVGEIAPAVPAIVQYRMRVGTAALPRSTGAAAQPAAAIVAAAPANGNSSALVPPPGTRLAPPVARATPAAIAGAELAEAQRAAAGAANTVVEPGAASNLRASTFPTEAIEHTDFAGQQPALVQPLNTAVQPGYSSSLQDSSIYAANAPVPNTYATNTGPLLSAFSQPGVAEFEPLPAPSAAVVASMLNWCRLNPPPAIDDWSPVQTGPAVGGYAGQPAYNRNPYLAANAGQANPPGTYTSTIRDIPTIESANAYGASQPASQFGSTWGQGNSTWQGNAPWGTAGNSGPIGQSGLSSPEFNPIATQPFEPVGDSASWPNRLVSYESELPAANPSPNDFWEKLSADANDPDNAFLRSTATYSSSEKPWPTLFWTVMALFASMGGNLYMGWIAADIVYRYRELAFEGRRHESRRFDVRNLDVRRLWRRRERDRDEEFSRDSDEREDRRDAA